MIIGGLFYSLIMASKVIEECENHYSIPPSGYVIITDGVFFRWKDTDLYISTYNCTSKQKAINYAWDFYEYKKRTSHKANQEWVKIE